MTKFAPTTPVPPYGKEYAKQMRTIFDFPHLMGASYFLDTQRAFFLYVLGTGVHHELTSSLTLRPHAGSTGKLPLRSHVRLEAQVLARRL